MMRSSNWLISAWKPKLSDAIFVRTVRKGEGGEMGMGATIERVGGERSEGRRFMYPAAVAVREPSILLQMRTDARVLALPASRRFGRLPRRSTAPSAFGILCLPPLCTAHVGDALGEDTSPCLPLTCPFSTSTIAFTSSFSCHSSSFSSRNLSFAFSNLRYSSEPSVSLCICVVFRAASRSFSDCLILFSSSRIRCLCALLGTFC